MNKLKKLIIAFMIAILATTIVPVYCENVKVEAATPKINKTKATLIKGQTLQLKVTNAKSVKWSTSKKSVATVTNKGKVSAKKTGKATITAKVGKKSYKCVVTVETPKISKTKITLYEKASATIKITGTKQTVKWSTSNKNVATVSKGKVIAKKSGNATITAKIGNKKYTCKVTVKKKNIPVTSIKLNTEHIIINKGEIQKVKYTILPNNATNKDVKWSTSNPDVAIIQNNSIKGINAGEAIITLKCGNITKSFDVRVIIPINKLTADRHANYIKVDQKHLLGYTISPIDYTEEFVAEWSSSDTSIATVDEKGVVTGISPGKVTIELKINNFKTSYEMEVEPKDSNYEIKKLKQYILDNGDVNSNGDKYIKYSHTDNKGRRAVSSISYNATGDKLNVSFVYYGTNESKSGVQFSFSDYDSLSNVTIKVVQLLSSTFGYMSETCVNLQEYSLTDTLYFEITEKTSIFITESTIQELDNSVVILSFTYMSDLLSQNGFSAKNLGMKNMI